MAAKKKSNDFVYLEFFNDNLMVFAALVVILIGSTAVSVARLSYDQKIVVPTTNNTTSVLGNSDSKYPKLPVRNEVNIQLPELTAMGVFAKDIDSGVTLYEKNSTSVLLPASTVKIMTALVAADYYPFDTVLTVDNLSVDGQKMDLINGEKITVENLIKGLLIYSANDAAEVLAQNYFGGRDSFIKSMNEKAIRLGLENTVFSTPTGLEGELQVTSAKDMVILAEYANRFPWFNQIVGSNEDVVASIDGEYIHPIKSTNKLLGKVEGVKGVKTGWTENARENLVTYYDNNDKRFMIAVLGSQDRFGETKILIDWIIANYQWEAVAIN